VKRLALLILPSALFIIWTIITITHFVDPLFLPTPLSVARSLILGFSSGQLALDLLATVARALVGFALSAAVGIPLGLLVGRIQLLARATQPTIDFFRSIPATALFPLFLFLFGIGDEAKVSIVVYACSLIILVNTAYGALQVKKARILSAQVMGASRWQIFWKIVVPESSPGIFAGLRVALSMAFVLVVVTEMFIGTAVGLGFKITRFRVLSG
jgi:NitT/TauT family transport system permease protein